MSLTAVDEGNYLKVSFQMKNKDYDLIMIKNNAVDPLIEIYNILDTYKDYANGYTIPLSDLSGNINLSSSSVNDDYYGIYNALDAIYNFSTDSSSGHRLHMSGGKEVNWPYENPSGVHYFEKRILLFYINNTNDVGGDGTVAPSTIINEYQRGKDDFEANNIYNMTHNLYNYIRDNSGNNQHVSADGNLSLDTGYNSGDARYFPGIPLVNNQFPHRLMYRDGASISDTYYVPDTLSGLTADTDPSRNIYRPMILLPKAPSAEEGEATAAGITGENINKIKNVTFTNNELDNDTISAIVSSITGTKNQKNKKRKSVLKLLFSITNSPDVIKIPKKDLILPNTFVKENVKVVKANKKFNIVDLSDNEGFYSVLNNNEYIKVETNQTEITFTRVDDGADEKYKVDVSFNQWGDLDVKRVD